MSKRAMLQLLAGVRDGNRTRYQRDPDEKAPVTGQTADEAWGALKKRGLVDPFHADELQRRQDKNRREQPCRNCGEPVGDGTEDGRYCGLMCAMEARDD